MKKSNRTAKVEAKAAPATKPAFDWTFYLGLLVAAVLVFLVYSPALRGPFLFDDLGLPYTREKDLQVDWKFYALGPRPLLYLVFWAEGNLWGANNPAPFHYVNLLCHLLDSLLVYVIVMKVAVLAGKPSRVAAAFCAGLFLLHPLQTEAVSYSASLSENLSVLFAYAAVALYLWRKPRPAGWAVALAVLLLAALAVATKEHGVVVPAVLLLADVWFDSIKKNWRLYALMALGGLGAIAFVYRLLLYNPTAGFATKGVTWYQYFFTECRALWVYPRLFLLPVGQNIDYQFPVSHSLTEHGAVIGLLGLAAISVLAWIWRRRFPLASFGWFTFLIMIAPTSSVVPIADALVERRMYLPFLGLAFIVAEAAIRYPRKGVMAAVLLVCAFLAYQRNGVYTSSVAMWQDAIMGNPANARAWFQLGYALYNENRCAEAATAYERVPSLIAPDYELMVDWAEALDCAGQATEAEQKARRATELKPTAHAYTVLGKMLAKQGKNDEALAALQKALALDRRFDMAWAYVGNVELQLGDPVKARDGFERALRINPSNPVAEAGLRMLDKR